jgi:ATP-dependent RNA helicase RhlE
MHGDKSQSQRERALARFEAGEVRTLVATDVAARGIDVDGIAHVINFDPPADREAYVHRVGRTARAGRSGVGTTFVGAQDAHDMGRIAAALDLHDQFARGGLAAPAHQGARLHQPAGKSPTRSRRGRPRR